MSLFKKIVADLDDIEALTANETGPPTPYAEWKSAESRLTEGEKGLERFAEKANEGRKDPSKKLYGDAMCARIDQAVERIGGVREKFDSRMAIESEKEAARAATEKLEREKIEEAERIAKEAKLKVVEAERARIAKEETDRKTEEERIRVEKRKRIEEEAERKRKQAAEEREAAKVRQAKEREEAAAKRAQDEKARGLADAQAKANATFSITIRSTGQMRSFDVSGLTADATVMTIKDGIFGSSKIPPPNQKLIFAGRVLLDDETLRACKIVEGVSVHLVERDPSTVPSSSAAPAVVNSVQHITNGAADLDGITSARTGKLTVVDYSAPWCGPCRALAPQLERLAKANPSVKFIGVDVEASQANGSLASAAGVSAYPTLTFLIGSGKVDEMKGANLAMLTQKIAQWKNAPSSSASSSTPGANGENTVVSPIVMPAGTNITERVLTAVRRIRSGSSQTDFILAVQTLIKFVRNVVGSPAEEKFRKVRWANPAFQQRVARLPGGPEAMLAFGFEEERKHDNPGTIDCLVISEDSARNPELATVMRQLEAVVPGTIPTPVHQPNQPVAQPAQGGMPFPGGLPGMPGMPGMPGVEGGGGMGNNAMMQGLMNDPAFATMAQDLMANPEAMNDLIGLQQAFERGDQEAVMRMANNPTLRRMQETMMQNPNVMNAMTNMMGRNAPPGGMANAGFPMPGMAAAPNPTTVPSPANATHPNAPPPAVAAQPPPTPLEGEPTSAEEEERLLAEAIRLSMNESNNNFNNNQDGNSN